MTKLFHWQDYITNQSASLLNYFQQGGKLIEITGEFLHDDFLWTVCSGYEKHSQGKILKQLLTSYPDTTLIYCINAKDLVRDKQLSQKYLSFEKYILKELAHISSLLNIKAHVVITLMDDNFIPPHVRDLEELLHNQWYTTQHYPLWKPYILQHSHTIVSSYDSKTGKSSLCASSWVPYTTWSSLPLSLDQYHPLNILAKAYNYRRQNQWNLSVFENFIADPASELYLKSCKELIEHRIGLYEKLLLSGYMDEEDVDHLKSLLIYLKN